MSVPELHLEKLVLIVDSNEAQRLIATWETVSAMKLPEDKRNEHWAEISRVDIDDLEALLPMLFENDILGEEGTVAEEALNYIRSRMLDLLQKPPR